ncbi:hypothetical protein GCM10009760_26200 [Kitasatospora kazusensis]|uniref:Uncharacterized protein n=1 Tax=Kitasatospora kazusensis TaxID=407974 RepID=A0ABN2ZG83_9ACTN
MSPHPTASNVTDDQIDAMRHTITALRERDALTVGTLDALLTLFTGWSDSTAKRTAVLEREIRSLRAQLATRCKCAVRQQTDSFNTHRG